MSRQPRRFFQHPDPQARQHFVFARVNADEQVAVRAAAEAAGLRLSNFVRRCINGYLLEQGDDAILIAEQERPGRRAKS